MVVCDGTLATATDPVLRRTKVLMVKQQQQRSGLDTFSVGSRGLRTVVERTKSLLWGGLYKALDAFPPHISFICLRNGYSIDQT